jgi:D-alanyl-lipoteichoic acid acyltransferase DltB (MBOAT superfamily)
MLFNSIEFLFFFPTVVLAYFLLPHRFRWILLLAASCFFYASFIPKYILILAGTIVIDYFAGIWIEGSEGTRRRLFLNLSIISNLGILAIFKYYNFFIDNLHPIFHDLPFLKWVLPVGLSFHTFQAMSYTIEVYRGNQAAERHFGIYALYVMFFPQLVAGPIERPQNLLHQFHERKYFNYTDVATGLKLMAWGFFKKLVIADKLSIFVDPVFKHPHDQPPLAMLIAVFFFSFQIYCDFSGYSDIALGSARVMGFKLMTNFNQPFRSRNITEFWRRWHISLSTWFNDYLFSPLAIRFRALGKWSVVLAIFITFFLSGLWHGAAWTFVLFGVFHGLTCIYEFLTKKFRRRLSQGVPPWLYVQGSVLLTYLYCVFIWIFFRAESMSDAFFFIRNIPAGLRAVPRFLSTRVWPITADVRQLLPSPTYMYMPMCVALLLGFIVLDHLRYNRQVVTTLMQKPAYLRLSLYGGLLLSIALFGTFDSRSFIYFQF